MYLGIDVGGTHTDAVVLKDGKIVASAKVPTDHHNLFSSVSKALDSVLYDVKPHDIRRFNLSTTLSTNAIVEGRTEEVGVIVSSGPGIDPENFRIGGFYHVIPGSIDHRGKEVRALDVAALDRAVAACREAGVSVFAAVTKFSTRNPAQENAIAAAVADQADFVSRGHRISGMLNFPRRISAAYYNAAVWRTYNEFADAVAGAAEDYGLLSRINILKADGGTMPFSVSRDQPVESILSGPAASVMGTIALCDISEDCVILDIGGTTTDIAVFADGAPLIETEGIEVGSYPTLVRALKTTSIGVGGDSRLHVVEGRVRVGPERNGPPMALGGARPALMDAFNYLELTDLGDVAASRAGIESLAALWDTFPEKMAREAVEASVTAILDAVEDMIWAINAKPVYTIHELLADKRVDPRTLYVMGGPAMAFQPLLSRAWGGRVVVPENYAVANAIGAALTRTTVEAELFADTEKGRMFIPKFGVEEAVGANYRLADAEADARRHLLARLGEFEALDEDPEVDVTEAGEFNMVGMRGERGRNIRVKCQIRPGILK
jgi:N-methylhydantoinase A/oxoprolinase/acetone carboxylase beta subunit